MATVALAENFRHNIAKAMESLGITQRELARRASVHYVTLCRLLNGTSDPSIDTCERLADALGMDRKKIFADPVDVN